MSVFGLCFKYSIKALFKQLVMFYLVSFVFGGCAFALLYFIKPQEILIRNGTYVGTYPLKIAILGGIVGFTITAIAFHFAKRRFTKKDMYCNITIYFKEKKRVKSHNDSRIHRYHKKIIG